MNFIETTPIDRPIDFKKIDLEDFTPHGYHAEKIEIEPNENGFINESLRPHIKLEGKETIVVNAGVGQGKSYATKQLARQYLNTDYIVIIAAPYKSLIGAYYDDLVEDDINRKRKTINYLKVGLEIADEQGEVINGKISPERVAKRQLHIITINSLLRNPGDDAPLSNEYKAEYLKLLVKRCEDKGKKVVIFFDEIHDGIKNFKEGYIFNLWKWRNCIHKVFILSATFNEASKVVIKYLAELTDDRIKIIECKRRRILNKQSKLHLCVFSDKDYKTNEENGLFNLIKKCLGEGDSLNILSYSKQLSMKIGVCTTTQKTLVSEMLHASSRMVNICISSGHSGSDSFDNMRWSKKYGHKNKPKKLNLYSYEKRKRFKTSSSL